MTARMEMALENVLTRSGCEGWWCASRLHDGVTIGRKQDEKITVTSLYKIRLLHLTLEAIQRGDLDPRLRVDVAPSKGTYEGYGFAAFDDAVNVSLRDLMKQVASVSDNVAAHEILRLLPAWAREAFLKRFPPHYDLQDRNSLVTAEKQLRQYVQSQGGRSTDIAFSAVSSLAEITNDLEQVWKDDSAAVRRSMCELLGLQVWRHRVPSGFPPSGVDIYGKTGTVGLLHGEASIIQVEGEEPIVVSIMLKQVVPEQAMSTHDGAIGEVARLLVDALR